jgi:hypothetical protein
MESKDRAWSTFKPWVLGSSPTRLTMFSTTYKRTI